MARDPRILAYSDWVLDRKNLNPFRVGTPEHCEYEAGSEFAQRAIPDA